MDNLQSPIDSLILEGYKQYSKIKYEYEAVWEKNNGLVRKENTVEWRESNDAVLLERMNIAKDQKRKCDEELEHKTAKRAKLDQDRQTARDKRKVAALEILGQENFECAIRNGMLGDWMALKKTTKFKIRDMPPIETIEMKLKQERSIAKAVEDYKANA